MDTLERVTGSAIDSDGKTRVYWQHFDQAKPAFDEQVFEDQWLAKQGYILNSPSAGRGASLFIKIDQHNLVLRHYRRGGMVRVFSEQSYIWTGLHKTRAWQEFDVLCTLEQNQLPAPRPYACQVKQQGMIYSATLVTHYLNGTTLAERMCTLPQKAEHWFAIGQCISRFHAAGVNHADLNAHNILLTDSGQVFMIDFDRATIDLTRQRNEFANNLKRLQRSLQKIHSSGPAHYDENDWATLMRGYEQGHQPVDESLR